jgi:cellobiose phosphorylase
VLTPCLPDDWPGYSLEYRYGRSTYQIEIIRVPPHTDLIEVRVDGVVQAGPAVPLRDDGRTHRVEMRC